MVGKISRLRILIVVLFAVGSSACQFVFPNSNDKTPPSSVVIRVKDANGQWQVQSDLTYYQGQSIDAWCTGEDPDGMKLLRVEYQDTKANTCFNSNNVGVSGGFSISVPTALQWEVGSYAGGVATTIPGYIKIAGPFTCTQHTAEPTGVGWPAGHTLTLRCIAYNQSSDPQTAQSFVDLKINLAPIP